MALGACLESLKSVAKSLRMTRTALASSDCEHTVRGRRSRVIQAAAAVPATPTPVCPPPAPRKGSVVRQMRRSSTDRSITH